MDEKRIAALVMRELAAILQNTEASGGYNDDEIWSDDLSSTLYGLGVKIEERARELDNEQE